MKKEYPRAIEGRNNGFCHTQVGDGRIQYRPPLPRSEPCYNVEIAKDASATLTGCAPQTPARIECHIQMAVDLAVEIGADA